MSKKPIVLTILDGYGINKNHKGNAVYEANTPNMDNFMKNYPNTVIHASGLDVGLPDGQMGNSEVGHTNIGAAELFIRNLQELQKKLRTERFLRMMLSKKRLKTAKKTARLSIFSDFCPTAVFTAI